MAQLVTLDLQNGRLPIRKTQISGASPCHKHATFVLDGIQSSGQRPGNSIRQFLLGYGDLVLVRYPHEAAFNGRQFASDILEAASKYELASLLGLSLGGLLAHDTVGKAPQDTTTTFNLLLADTPPGKDGLQRQRGAELLARFQGYDVPCERLLQTLMFKQFRPFPPRFIPKPAPHVGDDLTAEQKAELFEHVRLSAEYPLGPWFRQLAYIVQHGGPQPRVFDKARAVFLQSQYDELVRPDAYDAWDNAYQKAHGVSLPFIGVPSPHVGVVERPGEWRRALRGALGMLGVHPLRP